MIETNALTRRKPLLLTAAKDKPVLISALVAKCGCLSTSSVPI